MTSGGQDPGPPPRVRITSPRTSDPVHRRTPRPVTNEIDAQTELGAVYVRSLVRTQLRLAGGILLLLAAVAGGLPLLFHLAPGLSGRTVLGMPLSWVLLAFAVYPLLLALGWLYLRRAERNERAFTDMVGEP
jgi:hypothetical protein